MEIQGKAGKLYISDIHTDKAKGSVILAHGICHGAWCWDKMQNYLASHGFDSYALSYRGHEGSDGKDRLQDWTISDYVDDVKTTVAEVGRITGHKPFILGHSMGGAVVQRYIGKHEDTVCGAIFFAGATAPKMPLCSTVLSTYLCKDLKIAKYVSDGNTVSLDAMSESAFFKGGNVSRETIEKYGALLQRESNKVVRGLLTERFSDNYDVKIPILVIGSSTDSYFPKKSIKKTAGMYHVKPIILDGICHDMMLDERMAESADYILYFMEEVKP